MTIQASFALRALCVPCGQRLYFADVPPEYGKAPASGRSRRILLSLLTYRVSEKENESLILPLFEGGSGSMAGGIVIISQQLSDGVMLNFPASGFLWGSLPETATSCMTERLPHAGERIRNV